VPPITCKRKNANQGSRRTIKHRWVFGTCWMEGGLKTASKIAAETAKACHLVMTSPDGVGTPPDVLKNRACVSAWVDNSKARWSAA
jgi:hypothetical protein